MSEYNKFYIDSKGNIGTKKSGDNFLFGFLVGIIFPAILLLVLVYRETHYAMAELVSYSWQVAGNSLFYPYIIVSLMPNMFVFFWMYKTERWKLARGLVVATFLLFGLFAARASHCRLCLRIR